MRHHVVALLLLVTVGVLSLPGSKGPVSMTASPKLIYEWSAMGTRGFGYGALALLGAALMIGPLARLWPRRFSWILPYRRAVGFWSAIAGVCHLISVLLMLNNHTFDFYRRGPVALFVRVNYGVTPNGAKVAFYSLPLDSLSLVAWLGALGLSVLVVIALVSNDRAQRFLGHSAWKLVQQQAYAAFVFLSLHLLAMKYAGKMKGSLPVSRYAFWMLVAVALLQVSGFAMTVWKARRGGRRTAGQQAPPA